MLCGCYGGYTTVWRIIRACDCQQRCCSNSDTECVYLLRAKMEELYVVKEAKNDLRELSQHRMELATSLLSFSFGGDKH
eukprot:scaffold4969_cov43-Attheya_sp.AAC.1